MRAYEELLARGRSGDGAADPGRVGAELDRRPGRARGGEHPGANSRQPDDGPLEQVRLARPDHRQQERDVGRLRHPLRRHGGRLRGDQGRAEDARLPPGPLPQRARGPASWSPVRARARPVRRASPRTSATRTRCLPTSCSTGSSPPTSRRTAAATRSSPRAPAGGRRRGDRDGRSLRVQAPPGAAGIRITAEGVRPRPAPADHEPLPRLVGRSRPGPVARRPSSGRGRTAAPRRR